jgi:hypothetical protein
VRDKRQALASIASGRASRIQATARDLDGQIDAARGDLQQYRDASAHYAAQLRTCAAQREAAAQKAAAARAWAQYLTADEHQRLVADAVRALTTARQKVRLAREEAAAFERRRRRQEPQKEPARPAAKLAAEEKDLQQRQAAALTEFERAGKRFDDALRAAAKVSAGFTGQAPPPPQDFDASPPAPVLWPDELAYVQRLLDANAAAILEPSAGDEAAEVATFPTPAQPPPEALHALSEGVRAAVASTRFQAATLATAPASAEHLEATRESLHRLAPNLSRETEGDPDGKGFRQRLADAYLVLKDALRADKKRGPVEPTPEPSRAWLRPAAEDELAAMDPLDRHLRAFWRVFAESMPAPRSAWSGSALFRCDDEGLGELGKPLDEGHHP